MTTGTRAQRRTTDIASLAERILGMRRPPPSHALLVGVSGIDGSGKGWLGDRLAAHLQAAGARVALIHADGWLNLPAVRFSNERPGRHFYDNALRLQELFDTLVVPLATERSVRVTADYARETAAEFESRTWDYDNVDVVLVESIFLFKREHRTLFDLAIWVDCTLDTALERALERRQEDLPADETTRAYETIYFPAQRIHLERDNARDRADVLFVNDPRISDRSDMPRGLMHSASRAEAPQPRVSGTTWQSRDGLARWAVPEAALSRRHWDETSIRLPL